MVLFDYCRLSILQLAIDSTVYLLDVLTLSKLLSDDDWRHLVENVFCNETISVVGKCSLFVIKLLLLEVCGLIDTTHTHV